MQFPPERSTLAPLRALPGAVPPAVIVPVRRAGISSATSVLPLPVYIVAGLLVAAAALTSNPALTACCIISFVILAALLWRPGEPPVLFFACAVQWIQVAMKVFHADYY